MTGISTGTAMAIMAGTTLLGQMMQPGVQAAPAPKPPSPIPVAPGLDPKKRKQAEQQILRGGLGGTAELSRDQTILGGQVGSLG